MYMYLLTVYSCNYFSTSVVCLCPDRELVPNSVVLVRLHMIRFSCSEKASEGENLVLVLVSQLKRKKGYYT